ncbi:MAG: hypothetical protein P4L82_13120 [Ancalomicrobiaceae bacterium]|nr:hypothetical protein [Ancalomicrobiaceae bacterium]
MAEITNELIYEVLKAMQARLANIEHKLGELEARVIAFDGRVAGLRHEIGAGQTDIANVYNTLGHIDGRLMRIERRLELTSHPAQ